MIRVLQLMALIDGSAWNMPMMCATGAGYLLAQKINCSTQYTPLAWPQLMYARISKESDQKGVNHLTASIANHRLSDCAYKPGMSRDANVLFNVNDQVADT